MDAFFAVRILSSSESLLVSERNTGIAARGFATENSDVKLASKSVKAPNKKELSSARVGLENNSIIASKIERI